MQLHKNLSIPCIYDVDLQGVQRLYAYDQVELHVVLYPYSRQVSSDDIAFYPFEEYVKDVSSHQRSAYAEIRSHFNEVFGLLLGAVIALIFVRFNPSELLSIESIVSVFAAYTIGKELWDDIESLLVNVSKNWRLRFQDSYYRYQLEKHSTLTTYSYLAKRRRYGKSSALPARIDFIKQSNSQTLRMCFDVDDLEALAGPAGHVHSIHVGPDRLAEFEQGGFLFGVKVSLNRTRMGITRCLELFQSLDGGERGCLDERGDWVPGAVFYRHTLTLGRVKWYADRGLLHGQTLLEMGETDDGT